MTMSRLKELEWNNASKNMPELKEWLQIKEEERKKVLEGWRKSWAEKKKEWWKKEANIQTWIPDMARKSLDLTASLKWAKVELTKDKEKFLFYAEATKAFKHKWDSFEGYWKDYKTKFWHLANKDLKKLTDLKLDVWHGIIKEKVHARWKQKLGILSKFQEKYKRQAKERQAYLKAKETWLEKQLPRLSKVLSKLNLKRRTCPCKEKK
eukprot:TRINITY_DN8134_c1_g1_i2.p1 TRINITY_DN8134_c1_g1~~TRINITY_DN8134_c1_g1_i2.p1  ORF type:complete len:208 (-),score=41.93 TRINITY_DN8134_c1_g1_i2:301-924(-)